MKKWVLIGICLALLLSVIPVVAGAQGTAGERISLSPSGEKEFPAHTPFHIAHGWKTSELERGKPYGAFRFVLFVDGKRVMHDYIMTYQEGDWYYRTWVLNFEDGMSGVHTFTGSWIAPCQTAIERGVVDECADPRAPMEVHRTVNIIHFIP